MYTLTARRLEKIKPILDRYKEIAEVSSYFSPHSFEKEIRDTLDNCGFQEIKSVVIQLLKIPGYEKVAVGYMRHLVPVRTEFWTPLAEYYGEPDFPTLRAKWEAERNA